MVDQETDSFRVLLLHGCFNHLGKKAVEPDVEFGFPQREFQPVAAGFEVADILIEKPNAVIIQSLIHEDRECFFRVFRNEEILPLLAHFPNLQEFGILGTILVRVLERPFKRIHIPCLHGQLIDLFGNALQFVAIFLQERGYLFRVGPFGFKTFIVFIRMAEELNAGLGVGCLACLPQGIFYLGECRLCISGRLTDIGASRLEKRKCQKKCGNER